MLGTGRTGSGTLHPPSSGGGFVLALLTLLDHQDSMAASTGGVDYVRILFMHCRNSLL